MAINFNPNMSPDEYAKQYATQNNVSIDSARETLRSKYGEPTQNNDSIFGSLTTDTFTSSSNKSYDDIEASFLGEDTSGTTSLLKTIVDLLKEILGGNKEEKEQQDPDAYAQEYADKNNMTLDEAKAELKEKNGAPQKDGSNLDKDTTVTSKDETETEEVKTEETEVEETESEETKTEETDTEEETTSSSSSSSTSNPPPPPPLEPPAPEPPPTPEDMQAPPRF